MSDKVTTTTATNYKFALWPLFVTSLPLLYLGLYEASFRVTGNVDFLNNLGIWSLAIPSFLASLCLLTGTQVGLWLSRVLLLANVTFIKLLLMELNKNTDHLVNFPFLQIRRIWGSEDIYDKIATTLTFYNIKINPSVVAQMVEESHGSVIKAKGIATAYANKILNPTFWEKILNFTYSNLPTIVTTAVVGLAIGSLYMGIKSWLFPTDSLATAVGDLAKSTATIGVQQQAFVEHQHSINQKIVATTEATRQATVEIANTYGTSLNALTQQGIRQAQTQVAIARDLDQIGAVVERQSQILLPMIAPAPNNQAINPAPNVPLNNPPAVPDYHGIDLPF